MNTRMDATTSLASKLPAIPIWLIAAVLAAFVGLVFWSVLNDGYANIWGLEIGHYQGKVEASPLIVQHGTKLKDKRTIEVTFEREFSKEPTVLVSSYKKSANDAADHHPTVIDITTKGFTVISNSNASNYYISWVAFESAGS